MSTIRPASSRDLTAITGIYNEAVRTSTATFDTEPKTSAEQEAWLAGHGSVHPVLVAEEGGAVVAWASLGPWSDRCAYSDAVEDSVYVDEACRGRGIGRRLLEAILQEAVRAKHHTLLARVCAESVPSLRLHEALGFRQAGLLKEVGFKFGRRLDVVILQRMLLP
jgi:phosphinothricin acetyltransferase